MHRAARFRGDLVGVRQEEEREEGEKEEKQEGCNNAEARTERGAQEKEVRRGRQECPAVGHNAQRC